MSLDFSSSDSHSSTKLVQAFYQVQTPESCKPFSSDTNILRVHLSACTQTSVGAASSPIPMGPKAPTAHYYLLSFTRGLEPANVSSQEQHPSCEQVLPTQTLQR